MPMILQQNSCPVTDFVWIADHDEKKGDQLAKHRNDKFCREFVKSIAGVEREKVRYIGVGKVYHSLE